ncbi:hypothetical protein GIB67_005129 [Kingdonia uniflora]|uniref:Leucine-rich repeat-containing N-terminal plant-type domain-containing protein n=1 Tax=Kingdonia uniflora TaxID=39325 RepID=A0A7J7LA99_9MAGN|nr:hypothetical protein GIB67_005129 [Kingdonia uniflora]
MEKSSYFAALIVLFLLTIINVSSSSTSRDLPKVICIETEREALLSFKKGLIDHSLPSWNEDNCCAWMGVQCDNVTGHILQLDLRSPYDYTYLGSRFGGEVNSALSELKQLNYLDLSLNNFGGILVPPFLGSLPNLKWLKLSRAGCVGGKSLRWATNLSSLQELDMSGLDLSNTSDWLQVISMLPSLVVLHLSNCSLDKIHFLPNASFTSLLKLDLTHNQFTSLMPNSLYNLTRLVLLDLSYNRFRGPIHSSLNFFSSLERLYLSNNNFTGSLPKGIGLLSKLERSISHFPCNQMNKSYYLNIVNLSGNHFSGEFPPCWMDWPLLKLINMENNNLKGTIPSSVGSLVSLKSLNLRNNSLHGELPSSMQNWTRLIMMHIGGNKFSGNIPTWMGKSFPDLRSLVLHSNKFDGAIPLELCHLTSLQILDLSHNHLSEAIPRCFNNLSAMTIPQNTCPLYRFHISFRFDRKCIAGDKRNKAEI